MNKNNKLLLILAGVFSVMLVFGYANDRLFKLFCDAIGISLSPNSNYDPDAINTLSVDTTRTIKVVFNTEVMRDVPAFFTVKERSYDIHLGKTYENDYTFINRSNDTLYVRPVHSVYPASASTKYTMMECFCYDDMTLYPKQEITLPLTFYFSNDVSPYVNRIVMHYSLVKRDKDQVKGNK